MNRRTLLLGGSALALAGVGAAGLAGALSPRRADLAGRPRLAMPRLVDTRESGRLELAAQDGTVAFRDGVPSPTAGFDQDFLGPVIRMARGPLDVAIRNRRRVPVTTHWHGLMVPGEHDGGPHSQIAPGADWTPDMEIDQPPATAFYHTHAHGRTAADVYAGLAGVVHVTDGRDDDRGLPATYGVDDLTLVLQDRRFDGRGRMAYDLTMMDVMHGMTGDTLLINGQIAPVAVVPKGIVRLRLVNGSNARIYTLFFDDDRPLHLIATDGGFLDAPRALDRLRLAPGERAEVLVDLAQGSPPVLMSAGDPNQGPGGMMGRMRAVLDVLRDRSFEVLPFAIDEAQTARITRLPDALDGTRPDLASAVTGTRRISLDMPMNMGGGMMGNGMMGGGMMGGGMMGSSGGDALFGLNGRPFAMERIDFTVQRGAVERWIVESPMLSHPIHVHGAMFQVVSEDGGAPRAESLGWKDTVLVTGRSELFVRFDQPASRSHPFMVHCHILEHEDRGMMGQFTVT